MMSIVLEQMSILGHAEDRFRSLSLYCELFSGRGPFAVERGCKMGGQSVNRV
jgi:hypothetical protein